jgi:hypothetical protein
MKLQDDDPGAVFRAAMPEEEPPARFDLDRIVSEGYRSRRRQRAVLGGAATSGVAAVAAVLALSVTGLPGGHIDPSEDATGTSSASPGEDPPPIDDPAMAGYPYAQMDEWGSEAEADAVTAAAQAAFKDLTIAAGMFDESEFEPPEPPTEEEIQEYADSLGIPLGEAESMLLSEGEEPPLTFGANQYEGNEGQVFLRAYSTGFIEEGPYDVRSVLSLQAWLPGGWTTEPGPPTNQVFPQHLVSDYVIGASGDPAEVDITSETLDDGRELIVADSGCSYQVVVVYPNGTAFDAEWDKDCGGEAAYPVDLDDLKAAVLSMPEPEFDTSELEPIDELLDVPTGWLPDPNWESDAAGDAEATANAALPAVQQVFPEATIDSWAAVEVSMIDPEGAGERSYSLHGTLPFETTEDTITTDLTFDMRYYLPGGWIPGHGESTYPGAPFLIVCRDWDEYDDVCTETEVDGRRVVTSELYTEYVPEEGEPDEWGYTQTEWEVAVFHPDGWAVTVRVSFQDEVALTLDEMITLAMRLPAPVYDPNETPVIPGG